MTPDCQKAPGLIEAGCEDTGRMAANRHSRPFVRAVLANLRPIAYPSR